MLYLIASYPKSGNTYVRIFLAAYLRGRHELKDVGFPLYCSTYYFPQGFPLDRSECRPVCRHPLNFAKTHEVSDFYYPETAEKALYLVRNPLDVCPSWANHCMTTNAESVAALGRSTTLKQTPGKIFPQYIGTWSENVESWLFRSRIPVRAVKYEMLKSNPRRAFKIILDWFGLPFDSKRFDDALAYSDFSNLQKLEEKTGFRESRGREGFFRKGETGSWRGSLTFSEAAQIYADHGPMMRRLGYS